MKHLDELKHDEDGGMVETVEPDWDAIDRDVFHVRRTSEETTSYRMAVSALRKLLRWGFQNNMNNREGFIIRFKILCWNLLPEVQESYNLSELAGEDAKAKQSFGRWQDKFKRAFPNIPNAHKRHKK